jgi:hypothetical protein
MKNNKGKNNSNYKHGKYIKNYCEDCDKKISPQSIRCPSCSKKGKLNPAFKHGLVKTRLLYLKFRRKNDINYKIKECLRSRIYHALKKNIKSARTLELIGCTIEQLKKHLEKQFTSGMSWDNYGKWHVDHIKGCKEFDLSKKNEQLKCFNYSNLQPLWAVDNFTKHCYAK